MTSERGIPKVPKDLCKGAEVINCTRIEPTLGVDLSGEVERQWLSRLILLFKGFPCISACCESIWPDTMNFPQDSMCILCIYIYIWVNYNDLTATSLEIIVNKGNHPQMAQQFRLVKYYNLPRYMS